MPQLPVLALAVVVTVSPLAITTAAQSPTRELSREEQAAFLERAKIVRERKMSRGVTGTVRATLSDGGRTHDASIQTVDEYKTVFRGSRGTEMGFHDSWRYNLAAYHLDVLLELGMVPVTVERRHKSQSASFTWWVDDVMMDETERYKKKIVAPDATRWSHQLWTLRIFDQLIDNTDRNLGNMLIDRAWRVWMIDHTRAFRRRSELRNKANLTKIDRQLLARLKALDATRVGQAVGRWLREWEIAPILARRDRIVEHFETAGATALYDATPPR